MRKASREGVFSWKTNSCMRRVLRVNRRRRRTLVLRRLVGSDRVELLDNLLGFPPVMALMDEGCLDDELSYGSGLTGDISGQRTY